VSNSRRPDLPPGLDVHCERPGQWLIGGWKAERVRPGACQDGHGAGAHWHACFPGEPVLVQPSLPALCTAIAAWKKDR
jgi:hypothetical protein